MANGIVEYTIRLNDLASPAMRNFTATVSRSNGSFDKTSMRMLRRYALVTKSIETNARAARDMQMNVASLTRNVDTLTRSLQRAGSVKPQGGSMLGDILKGNIASGAIMGGVQMLTQGIGTAIQEAFGRQQIQASFRQIAETPAMGEALTEQLRVLSRDTILGSEVFKQAQTMMAFGMESSVVTDRIKRIGDLTLGDAQRAQSMTLALAQMTATGRLQGQDKLQMVSAGWNPLQALSESTGMSMAALEEQMSAGKISADMVWQALERATDEGGKFYGVMDAIANTPMGQYQQMMGSVNETVISIGQTLMPIVTWIMQIVNNYILPLVDVLLPYIEKSIQSVTLLLQNIFAALQPIFSTLSGITESGGMFSKIVAYASNLFNRLVPVVGKIVGFVADMVSYFVELIDKSYLWQGIIEGVEGVVGIIVNVVDAVIDGLKWLFYNVVKPIDEMFVKITNTIIRMLGLTPKSVKASSASGGSVNRQSSMPGITGTQSGNLSARMSANNAASQQSASTISGGGQKIITIQVAKLFDDININTATLREGVQELESMVLEALSRVLAQGALTAQS